MHALYTLLPDLCGILLATVGVALTVFREALLRLDNKPWHRGLLAAVMVIVGVLGTTSAVQQKHDSDRKQKELQALISSYGPKLDELIARSNDPEVRKESTDLKTSLAAASLARSFIHTFVW